MDDKIQEIADTFADKYQTFIAKSGYYNTSLHTRKCKICSLPEKERMHVNKLIMEGFSPDIIITYLVDAHPDMFTKQYTGKILQRHKNYLPYIIGDVNIKTIFARAKHIIEKKDLDNLTIDERVRLITDIEEEIVKEYASMENERISLLNVLFKETLPLIMTRLNESIIKGSYKEIKYITESSNIILKMSTAMAAYGLDINGKNTDKKEPDTINVNEIDEEKGNIKENVVSLTDRINKAVGEIK
jgi:hypothetical protein